MTNNDFVIGQLFGNNFSGMANYNQLYANDMRFYVILAYTAILLPSKFDNIENAVNLYLNPPLAPALAPALAPGPVPVPAPAPAPIPHIDLLNEMFLKKWINCYKYEHIGSWLIEMWCDVMCKFSQSNLECNINYNIFALAAGLNNFGNNKLQSIINVFKPQLTEDIFNLPLTEDLKIRIWIGLLLNNDVNQVFLGNIFNPVGLFNWDNIIINLSIELQELDLLLDRYLTNPNFNHDNAQQLFPHNSLYQKYYKSTDIKENICIIILEIYKGLQNKPMKQTILDTIYYFNLIDRNNVIFDDFQKNNTNYMYNNRNFPMYSASDTSLHNFIRISKQINEDNYNLNPTIPVQMIIISNMRVTHNLLNINNFKMAHFLGLNYEGIFEHVNYHLNNFISVQSGNNQRNYSFTFIQPPPAPLPLAPPINHRLLNAGVLPYERLMANNVELPLKYIKLSHAVGLQDNLQPVSKYYYYDIHDRPYISPTIHSYAHMLLKTINELQKEISDIVDKINSIVGELVNNRTTQIGDLYLNLYTDIVFKNQLLRGYIQSFNEFNQLVSNNQIWENSNLRRGYTTKNTYQVETLATYLNEINANYYLYYYIYSPDNLVKLSRFNFYQIPINRPFRINYFDNINEELIDIKNELSPNPNPFLLQQSQVDPTSSNIYRLISHGNYNLILNQYFQNYFYNNFSTSNNDFIKYKSINLPPSLQNNLDKFYRYVLIELIERLLNYIERNKGNIQNITEIWQQADKIVKLRGLINENYDLSIYLFIAKIIQELVKEQINVYVNNYVDKKFFEDINGLQIPNLQSDIIFNIKQISVNLDKISTNVQMLKNFRFFENMYSNVLSSKIKNLFIKYPNDLTNMNKYRSKYGMEINEEIIKLMIDNGASLYDYAQDGTPPFYPIIKNYNWKIVRLLKQNYDVDFRDDENESQNFHINFIKTENLNNLKKVLGNYNFIDPIKSVLSNIDENLYMDVEMSIKSNQAFGNNILSNLKYSFNLSSYLTLQILSESLMNFNNSFSFTNLNSILTMFNMNITDINSNYWAKVTDQLEIPNDFNFITIKQIRDEKIEERKKLSSEIDIINNTLRQIGLNNPQLAQNYQNKMRPKYLSLNNEYFSKVYDIRSLNILLNNPPNLTNNMPNSPNLDTIDRYQFNNDYAKINFEVWKGIFEKPINFNNTSNFNLLPIYIFDKQYKLIDKFNLSNKTELELIEKALELWANFAENYFLTAKYTEKNIGLEYADKMLIYLTKMTFGTNIELIIRKILFTYLLESSSKINKIIGINRRIDYYLTTELITDSEGNNQSLLNYLYDVICPKLVINATEIFKHKKDEAAFELQSTREILLVYFSFMEVIPLPEEIMEYFKKEVTNYFDTITSKTILLWYVNYENILKFMINNHRCLRTFLEML
jgi:hypothetical protein